MWTIAPGIAGRRAVVCNSLVHRSGGIGQTPDLPNSYFDPVLWQIGPVKLHWYGLMYVLGFIAAGLLASYRIKRQADLGWTLEQFWDFLFYAILGVLVGGRLGFMLVYDWPQWWQQPLSLFKVWQGGMSFHGGMLGVFFATWLFAKRRGKTFFAVTDFIAPLVPLGLAFGRLGNFINGELWGRVSDVPWAMVFPNAGPLARHPSQLYEAALEGVVLFLLLWLFSAKPRPKRAVSGLFLLGYGIARTLVECFREPDVQLGFIGFNWLTMGQILSVPMVVLGIYLLWTAYHQQDDTQRQVGI